MSGAAEPGISWVVLSIGDRQRELAEAIASIHAAGFDRVIVVDNGSGGRVEAAGAEVIAVDDNIGIPGGRDVGLGAATTSIVGFLDDDAVLSTAETDRILRAVFSADPTIGVVTFRIIDEDGGTARRHNPRVGRSGMDQAGEVATFLGGACAIRRSAYEASGGYWPELFYAHEELDLAWRVRDAGYRVVYRPDIVVRHPRVDISRHPDGWRHTGQNRVMVARRNLPWPLLFLHTVGWLVAGTIRTPDRTCRRSYLSGWLDGWRRDVVRRPIAWRTIVELTRLGRPPIL